MQIGFPSGQIYKDNRHLYVYKMVLELLVWVVEN